MGLRHNLLTLFEEDMWKTTIQRSPLGYDKYKQGDYAFRKNVQIAVCVVRASLKSARIGAKSRCVFFC